jgi:hypothetical protein
MSTIRELKDGEFTNEVLESALPVLADMIVGLPSPAQLHGKLEAVAHASLNFGVCGCSA